MKNRILELINKFINNNDDKHLSIGIILNNKTYKYHFTNKDKVDNDFEYFIGSISKTFTAHLIMKYVNEKKLDLNTSCGVYLGIGDNYPSISDLLHHKAGYNHFTPYEIVLKNLLLHNYNKTNIYEGIDDDIVIKLLKRRIKKKNYNYSYSDFNYAILSCILNKITSINSDTLMNDFIKKDLGLSHTYIGNKELKSIYKNKTIPSWKWNENNPYSYAGGIISNIDDLIKYMDLQLNSKDPMINECHKISYTKGDKELIACGWHCKKNNKHLWHVGGVGTHRSSMIISKHRKIAVTVLCNSPGINKANSHYLCKLIYSYLVRNKNKLNEIF